MGKLTGGKRGAMQAIMDLIFLLSISLGSDQLISYLFILAFIFMLFCFPVASLFTYNLLFKAISRSNYIDSKWEKAQVGLRVV